MSQAARLGSPKQKGAVSAAECPTRVDLAACYRLMAHFGFTHLIYNHTTFSVPVEPGHFLINPYGRFHDEVTASSLDVLDLEGNVIRRGDPDKGVNLADHVIHSAVHAARADGACEIQTHIRWDAAVSAMDCGVSPINQTALRFQGHTGHHDYQGPVIDKAERVALVANPGTHGALIMRNRGALVCGRSLAEISPDAVLSFRLRDPVGSHGGGGRDCPAFGRCKGAPRVQSRAHLQRNACGPHGPEGMDGAAALSRQRG